LVLSVPKHPLASGFLLQRSFCRFSRVVCCHSVAVCLVTRHCWSADKHPSVGSRSLSCEQHEAHERHLCAARDMYHLHLVPSQCLSTVELSSLLPDTPTILTRLALFNFCLWASVSVLILACVPQVCLRTLSTTWSRPISDSIHRICLRTSARCWTVSAALATNSVWDVLLAPQFFRYCSLRATTCISSTVCLYFCVTLTVTCRSCPSQRCLARGDHCRPEEIHQSKRAAGTSLLLCNPSYVPAKSP
jgi:hypothetical protein